jgi:hypothetical protein
MAQAAGQLVNWFAGAAAVMLQLSWQQETCCVKSSQSLAYLNMKTLVSLQLQMLAAYVTPVTAVQHFQQLLQHQTHGTYIPARVADLCMTQLHGHDAYTTSASHGAVELLLRT